jgi:hypothetical protein
MVTRVAATSKCREKCKNPEKPKLVGDTEGTPTFATVLPLPPPSTSSFPPLEVETTSNGEVPEANMLTRPSPGVLETAITPPLPQAT